MSRPLVSVVFAYAAGLLLAEVFHPPLVALFTVSFGVLVPALAFGKLRPYLLWALLILAGCTNLEMRTAVVSPNDLRTRVGNQPAIVTVRGKLAETPRLKVVELDNGEEQHSLVRVRVSEIRIGKTFSPASGEIIVSTPDVLASGYFAGQPVRISGVISHPPSPLAEGLFDYQHYLAERGIYYQIKTSSTNDWKLLKPHLSHPPLTDRFLHWAKNTLAFGLPGEDQPLRLIWAMTLGWRTAFTGDISEPFLRAGTMHLFAIDGLRIALLSGIIVTLLRVLRLSRAWCGAIAIPTIWFYTAATGWEPSAIRASVMMTIVLGGWVLKRPGDLLNSLAAAAFVILVWEPRQLFEASFQLSFFVVLIISLMLPPLNEFFDRVLRHDPLLAEELLPRWRRTTLWLSRKFARYCALSFAAWIGSLPLAARYFHLLSPVSTLANIFAVPLGTLALMANLGALICGQWLSWFTILFNNAAWFFMVAMTWVSVEFTKIPGSYFYVPSPSLASIAIFYAAVFAVCSGWFSTWRKKLFGMVILLGIAGFYFWQWQSSRDETDLTVLPLNGGHAIYVDAVGRQHDWLINCGNEDAVQFSLKNYLRAQGVNYIPRLVLTEANARNAGGAGLLDQLFGVGQLWTGDAKFHSTAYRHVIAAFEDPPSHHKIMHCGDNIGCWQVLFPQPTSGFSRADDRPLVLRGNFRGTKILLLANLSRDGQSALLSQTNNLHADIVVAGLPGQDEPLCNSLINAIQPRVIIIADSEFPATRRASSGLHERLKQTGIPVIYTRTAGAVKIETDDDGWKLQATDGLAFSSASLSTQPRRNALPE